MRAQLTNRLLTVAVVASIAILTGCAPAPSLTRDDVVGTWMLEEGGQVTFDDETVRFENFFVSPLSGTGSDAEFQGSGTWELEGKSSIAFVLPEWSGRLGRSIAGRAEGGTLKAVQKSGRVQITIFDPDKEIEYFLKKDR